MPICYFSGNRNDSNFWANATSYERTYPGQGCGFQKYLTFHVCQAWREKIAIIFMRRAQVRIINEFVSRLKKKEGNTIICV